MAKFGQGYSGERRLAVPCGRAVGGRRMLARGAGAADGRGERARVTATCAGL